MSKQLITNDTAPYKSFLPSINMPKMSVPKMNLPSISMPNFTSSLLLPYIVAFLAFIFIVCIIIYYILNLSCNKTIPYGSTINCLSIPRSASAASQFKYTLKDYYIKTAYNCCSVGCYKNCYVNTDMLKYVLQQGCRCLDFAIYSKDGEPIVAASYLQNNTKSTINYIPFATVMSILKDYAFASGTCPNPNDPLFIHLRIYSSNNDMFKNLTTIMKQYNNILLDPTFSWVNKGNDNKINIHYLGDVPLLQFPQNKIAVIIQENKSCIDDSCPLYEYVNLVSGSSNMHIFNYSDMINQNPEDIKHFNKQYIYFIMPDVGDDPVNPNSQKCTDLGCQFVAMRYQLEDNHLATNNKLFNDNGYAFKLKPQDLRYIPIPIIPAIPQNPAFSYASRDIETAAGKLYI